jgi:hypothetical protein
MRRTLDELQEPGVVATELVPVPEQILALRRSQNPPLCLQDHRQYVLCGHKQGQCRLGAQAQQTSRHDVFEVPWTRERGS